MQVEIFYILKSYSPTLTVPPLSPLNTCTPTKSNLYLAKSLATAVTDPDPYTLLTLQMPFHMSILLYSGCTEFSSKVWGNCESFVKV